MKQKPNSRWDADPEGRRAYQRRAAALPVLRKVFAATTHPAVRLRLAATLLDQFGDILTGPEAVYLRAVIRTDGLLPAGLTPPAIV